MLNVLLGMSYFFKEANRPVEKPEAKEPGKQ